MLVYKDGWKPTVISWVLLVARSATNYNDKHFIKIQPVNKIVYVCL